MRRMQVCSALFSVIVSSTSLAQHVDIPIRNWDVPRLYASPGSREVQRPALTREATSFHQAVDDSLSAAQNGLSGPVPASQTGPFEPAAAASGPLVFVALDPCRVLDTRGISPPAPPYGAPSLSNSVTREFQVGGTCGVPVDAAAVSANATAVGTQGPGHLTLWAGLGATKPGSSNVNWVASGQTVANSAIIPLSSSGSISAFQYTATGGALDLVLDVNGYYAQAPFGYAECTLATSNQFPTSAVTSVASADGCWTSNSAVLGYSMSPALFTVYRGGLYEFSASLPFSPTTWGASWIVLFAQFPGVGGYNFAQRDVTSGFTSVVAMVGTFQINLSAGQQITLAVQHSGGSTLSIYNWPYSYRKMTIRYVAER